MLFISGNNLKEIFKNTHEPSYSETKIFFAFFWTVFIIWGVLSMFH